MLKEQITGLSIVLFRKRSQGKKIVLLYPWFHCRNAFLSYFLQQNEYPFLYYRFTVADAQSLRYAVHQIVLQFSQSIPEFGHQTRALLKSDTADHAFGTALANDLAKACHNEQQVFICLDEVDRIPTHESYNQFVYQFIEALPTNMQLIVNGRALPYLPWLEAASRYDSVIFGSPARTYGQLLEASQDQALLDIYGFGTGHALINGIEIDNWDGILPRRLFFYLVDNERVTREQIFAIFWDTLKKKEAINVFHVTKRKITELLTQYAHTDEPFELTQYSNGFYIPGEKLVRYYDVAQFEQLIDHANRTFDDAQREGYLQQAISIYRAPYLTDLDLHWANERREKLQHQFVEALIGVGRICQARAAHEQALGYYTRVLREMPYREDIIREVMRIYVLLDAPHKALHQYHLLEVYLAKALQIRPSKESRALYENIRQRR